MRSRRRHEPVDLRRAWESHAEAWADWARKPGHDSYEHFHRDRFLELLPPPGRLTVDVGCGEGRLGRNLMARGDRVIGIDGSPTLARLATTAEPRQTTVVADAADLPIRGRVADLAVAMVSLQDIDDLEDAVAEVARILLPGGHFCFSVVHPMHSAGDFAGTEPDSPWVMAGSYFAVRNYSDEVERDGLQMTFASVHRPLEAFSRALERAGLLVEAMREVSPQDPSTRWSRLPGFLHVRAVKHMAMPGPLG
jgi:SAM-dependent methyltransferase